jgi:signal transduction histidine kinase
MKKRSWLLYIPVVLIPIAGLVIFGVRSVAGEKDRWQVARVVRAEERLRGVAAVLAASQDSVEGEILAWRMLADLDAGEIRSRSRGIPFARQVFLLDGQGSFLYPPPDDRSNRDEEFFTRTGALWGAGTDFQLREEEGGFVPMGWHPYYEGNSVSWIFWIRTEDGRILGFDLFREYFLSRVLRYFRESLPESESAAERILLFDEFGHVMGQTGGYSPPDNERPVAMLPLGEPFGGWRLEIFRPEDVMAPGGGVLSLILTSLALGIALVGSAFLLIRENTREIREARKKVSFVNQVSHELKTPLTNIRMYAEMLEARLEEGSAEKRYSEVLVRESDRLGRMIGNVLSFARDSVKPRPVPSVPDELVGKVLEAARPRLTERSMTLEFEGHAAEVVNLDGDFLQQIVWNLVSNGEKYGASGRWLGVSTRMEGSRLVVEVADRGPGIPTGSRDAVFKPFYRVHDDITEGVSGAGLGLPISRDLARKHGGDLILLPSEMGTLFRLTLETAAAGGDR